MQLPQQRLLLRPTAGGVSSILVLVLVLIPVPVLVLVLVLGGVTLRGIGRFLESRGVFFETFGLDARAEARG